MNLWIESRLNSPQFNSHNSIHVWNNGKDKDFEIFNKAMRKLEGPNICLSCLPEWRIFHSWQLRKKKYYFDENDKQTFGPSYFIRALKKFKGLLALSCQCIRLLDSVALYLDITFNYLRHSFNVLHKKQVQDRNSFKTHKFTLSILYEVIYF